MTLDQRIRADIEDCIRSGTWRPGHRIPFEHELVGRYGCSRATVSKALTALARSGLIERRRKAGSFVAHPHFRSAVLDIPDIGALATRKGGRYRWELTSSHILPSPKRAAREAMPDFRGPLLELSGVHHALDAPFGIEERLVDLASVPEAADADFTTVAPGAWLLDRIPWTDARHRICATGASEAHARALAIAVGEPCLQIERWTWRRGRPVTFVRQTFPGDRYDLVAEFTPQSR